MSDSPKYAEVGCYYYNVMHPGKTIYIHKITGYNDLLVSSNYGEKYYMNKDEFFLMYRKGPSYKNTKLYNILCKPKENLDKRLYYENT